jgi:hypothetical protein
VQTIQQEMRTEGCFVYPRKQKAKSKSDTKLNDFEKDILRRTVYNMYDDAEFCTAQRILKSLKIKINYSSLLRSVYNILHQ